MAAPDKLREAGEDLVEIHRFIRRYGGDRGLREPQPFTLSRPARGGRWW
jgi:hypothetical protein